MFGVGGYIITAVDDSISVLDAAIGIGNTGLVNLLVTVRIFPK
jgi:hypothetical protein